MLSYINLDEIFFFLLFFHHVTEQNQGFKRLVLFVNHVCNQRFGAMTGPDIVNENSKKCNLNILKYPFGQTTP